MTINAVLFDFANTLFHPDPEVFARAELTDDDGAPLGAEERAELIRRLTTQSGGAAGLDGEYLDAFRNRDLDPAANRKAYLEVLRLSGVTRRANAVTLYEHTVDPMSWVPYPDTGQALKTASGAGLAVGVLSNISFDFRPAFTGRGLDGYVDEFVLSYEVGVVKPDPAIFRLAAHRLGVAPEQTLMVGDSVSADGAARDVGCAFAAVEAAAPEQRPDGLCAALRSHRVT